MLDEMLAERRDFFFEFEGILFVSERIRRNAKN